MLRGFLRYLVSIIAMLAVTVISVNLIFNFQTDRLNQAVAALSSVDLSLLTVDGLPVCEDTDLNFSLGNVQYDGKDIQKTRDFQREMGQDYYKKFDSDGKLEKVIYADHNRGLIAEVYTGYAAIRREGYTKVNFFTDGIYKTATGFLFSVVTMGAIYGFIRSQTQRTAGSLFSRLINTIKQKCTGK